MKLEFHPQRFQVMGRHLFISSQQRTMDCFSNATAQKLQQRMMTVYFPETISTSVPISHPPTLADVTEEKLLKSWANKLWKQLLFSRRFEGAFTHSKTQKRDFSSSCSSAEPVAAARISHTLRNDPVFTASPRCCVTAKCNTIASLQAPLHAADTGAGDSG